MATDGEPTLACDVGSLVDPDLATVAVLARMQLIARRLGCEMRLHSCPERLRELLVLAGLEEALPVESLLAGGVGVEARRQTEQREHARGVQEEADTGDLPI